MTARPFWSEWRDLNSRPHGPEPCALPAALHPVKPVYYNDCSGKCQEKNPGWARRAQKSRMGTARTRRKREGLGPRAKAPDMARHCGPGDNPSVTALAWDRAATPPLTQGRQGCIFIFTFLSFFFLSAETAPLRHFVTPLPDAGRGRSASFAAGSAMALPPRRGERQECFFCRWQRDGTFPPTRGEASVRFEDRMA